MLLKNIAGVCASTLLMSVSLGYLGTLPLIFLLAVVTDSLVLALGATIFGWIMFWIFRLSKALWWTRLHMLLERRGKVSPEEDVLIVRAARMPWPLHKLNSPDPPRHY